MQRVTGRLGSMAVASGLPAVVGIFLMVVFFAYACGKDDATGSSSFQCEVTLTLVPSRVGDLSSPSGSGRGTGTGATQQEALSAALRTACSQLNLSSDLRRTCEAGQDFSVAVTSGGITVASLVERSQRCSGSSGQ